MKIDKIIPTGGSITYSCAGYCTVGEYPAITYTIGTDAGGSGLKTSSGKIQRASATLAAGACGTYGSFSDLVTEYDGSYSDTTVTSGNCYKYQYLISDNAGNTSAPYTSVSVVKVDTVAPTVSAGSNQTKSAIFTQIATVSDLTSGIKTSSYQWSKVSGPGTVTFGSATALSTTISASTSGTYVIQFSVSDNAGNVNTATFTLTWN